MLYNDQNITYTSELGRKFRMSKLTMLYETEKWIGRTLKYHWTITIHFLDNNERMQLTYDYNDNIIKKQKYETKKID